MQPSGECIEFGARLRQSPDNCFVRADGPELTVAGYLEFVENGAFVDLVRMKLERERAKLREPVASIMSSRLAPVPVRSSSSRRSALVWRRGGAISAMSAEVDVCSLLMAVLCREQGTSAGSHHHKPGSSAAGRAAYPRRAAIYEELQCSCEGGSPARTFIFFSKLGSESTSVPLVASVLSGCLSCRFLSVHKRVSCRYAERMPRPRACTG